jgi:CopG family transcriptional regulator / antitoxin EndoAI
MRASKLVTISVLPDLLKKADEIAREESRTRSELWREVMRRYIAEKELKRLQRYGDQQARTIGLEEKDVQRLVDEYRAEKSDG